MDAAVVEEQVDALVADSIRASDSFEEAEELRGVEAVVLDLEAQELVARADGSADCLARLLSSPVFDHLVLVDPGVGCLLEMSPGSNLE